MLQIIRTPQAREDVLDIWDYIGVDNPAAADTVVRRLDEVVRLLADHPNIGTRQDRFRKGLRCLSADDYLIFYDQSEGRLRIIRILHGARRWEHLIPRGPISE